VALEDTGWETLADGTSYNFTVHPGAVGGLRENVEFDKQKFAAYADSVTLSKMHLLQETIPDVHLFELTKDTQSR